MATACFNGVKITGMACAVPVHKECVDDFADVFSKEEIEKFSATTGVRERHFVEDKQTNSDLCYVAAEKIIAHKGYDKSSFDGIVYVSQSPDYAYPATAYVLHKRLGFSKDCMAFDVNLGCSGFVYGVNIIASMVQSGALKRVLLCCGESHGQLYARTSKASSMLFGDAGSATIIEAGDDCIKTLMKADGEGYEVILSPGLTSRVKINVNKPDLRKIQFLMDGSAVFEFSIIQVPRSFKEFFKVFGGTIDDYDYCAFHQANLFMLEHIRKKIKLKPEKMPISIDRYGNTSSASIPMTITDCMNNEKCTGKKHLITSGFGIGLSWGIADFSLDAEDVLPIIETDDYFKEAYVGPSLPPPQVGRNQDASKHSEKF